MKKEIPPELKANIDTLSELPVPAGLRRGRELVSAVREEVAQAEVDIVDVILRHRADLASLRTFVDRDWPRFSERDRQAEFLQAVDKLIEAADRRLIAVRG